MFVLIFLTFVELFEKQLLHKFGTISEEDMSIFKMVDSVDEAYDYIMKHVDLKANNLQI